MILNDTRTTQLIQDSLTGKSIEVPPRCLYSDLLGRYGWGTDVESLDSLISDRTRGFVNNILIQRMGALGDVMMLIPMIKKLSSKFNGIRITVRTGMDARRILMAVPGVVGVVESEPRGNEYDFGIVLDGTVERDRAVLKGVNRVDIYNRMVFGSMEPSFMPPFSLKFDRVNKFASVFARQDKKFAAIAVKGSRKINTVPWTSMRVVGEGLAARGYTPVLLCVDPLPDAVVPNGWVNLTGKGKANPFEALTVLDSCQLLVTTDSGLFWLSHITGTVCVLLAGPYPVVRAKYHPACVYVDLAKPVNCDHCFENPEKCDGRVDCLMSLSGKEVWREIERAMRSV